MFFLFLLFSTSALAAGAQFRAEPYLSYVMKGDFDDGTSEGDFSGYGVGLQVFGFFTSNFYLGLNGQYGVNEVEDITGGVIENVEGSVFFGGPVLGFYTNRFRIWASYLLADQWAQDHNAVGSTTVVENTYKGEGFQAGISFWVWKNMSLGAVYSFHKYSEDDSGALTTDLKINTIDFVLSFPFEIF